jgi:hypothetical protein
MHINTVQPATTADANVIASRKGIQMMDVILLAIGLGFFAVSVGYAYACERL